MLQRVLRELAGSRPAADPAAAALAGLDPALARALFPGPLLPAAVLVPLLDRPGQPTVLLTRRTEHLRDHPGQISFPGGRLEPGDSGPLAAALREAEEEVGLSPATIRVAGYLPPHPVVTGFVVTPVVALLAPPEALRLDPYEVAEAFEVPLDWIVGASGRREAAREVRGLQVPTVEYRFQQHRIWGATAQMLDTLRKVIINN